MEKFVPDIYQENIYTINYNKLYEQGIRNLLFDLDNTLVESHVKTPNEQIKNLFQELRDKGFHIILFSNCTQARMKVFNQELSEEAYHGSKKPFTGKFLKILKKYGWSVNEVAIIGDQLFTDILGGNRVGITTVLVDKVGKDGFATKIIRLFENRMIKKLRKKSLFARGRYYE